MSNAGTWLCKCGGITPVGRALCILCGQGNPATAPKLRVQMKCCKTCIFRESSTLDLPKLLDDVREEGRGGEMGYFKGHRVCHYSADAVCAGFWALFKDKFQLGQLAQRLGLVQYVQDNVNPLEEGEPMSNKSRVKREIRFERQHEPQRRLYTRNLAADALRAARPDEPPVLHPSGLTQAEMDHAVAVANGRLEDKQFPLHLPAGGTKPIGQRIVPSPAHLAAQRTRGSDPRGSRVVTVPPEPVIVITEAELLAALGEAQTSGRTQLDVPTLAKLLAEHTPLRYQDQKGFAKWLK